MVLIITGSILFAVACMAFVARLFDYLDDGDILAAFISVLIGAGGGVFVAEMYTSPLTATLVMSWALMVGGMVWLAGGAAAMSAGVRQLVRFTLQSVKHR